jgi:hypothetical protein
MNDNLNKGLHWTVSLAASIKMAIDRLHKCLEIIKRLRKFFYEVRTTLNGRCWVLCFYNLL